MQTSTNRTMKDAVRDAGRFFARCSRLWVGLVALLLLAGLTSAYAQHITGAIAGSVKDATGAVVANADVKVMNTATGFARATVTDNTGTYNIQYLPVGRYTLEV